MQFVIPLKRISEVSVLSIQYITLVFNTLIFKIDLPISNCHLFLPQHAQLFHTDEECQSRHVILN